MNKIIFIDILSKKQKKKFSFALNVIVFGLIKKILVHQGVLIMKMHSMKEVLNLLGMMNYIKIFYMNNPASVGWALVAHRVV